MKWNLDNLKNNPSKNFSKCFGFIKSITSIIIHKLVTQKKKIRHFSHLNHFYLIHFIISHYLYSYILQ